VCVLNKPKKLIKAFKTHGEEIFELKTSLMSNENSSCISNLKEDRSSEVI